MAGRLLLLGLLRLGHLLQLQMPGQAWLLLVGNVASAGCTWPSLR